MRTPINRWGGAIFVVGLLTFIICGLAELDRSLENDFVALFGPPLALMAALSLALNKWTRYRDLLGIGPAWLGVTILCGVFVLLCLVTLAGGSERDASLEGIVFGLVVGGGALTFALATGLHRLIPQALSGSNEAWLDPLDDDSES